MATIKRCPNVSCEHNADGLKDRFYVKWGYFKPSWSKRPVPRYKCKTCGKTFSASTAKVETLNEKRPDVNQMVFDLYCSRMSLRRIAKVLQINRKTVVRKFYKLAGIAKGHHEWLIANQKIPCSDMIAVDEMEANEGSKVRPLTMTIAVDGTNGRVLDISVSEIKAKGKIVSKRKIDQVKANRIDTSSKGFKKVLSSIKIMKSKEKAPTIFTDGKKVYITHLKTILPEAKHIRSIGRVNSKYDPIWWLNHACAMFRHDLSRLSRKSIVFSRTKKGLEAHMYLYIAWKNGYSII